VPTYEYKCKCGEHVDRVSTMAEMKSKVKCPACGKMAPRCLSSFPAVQCRYSYLERTQGNPRATRGRGY
jgi:putative FmdB family regulatory protein